MNVMRQSGTVATMRTSTAKMDKNLAINTVRIPETEKERGTLQKRRSMRDRLRNWRRFVSNPAE